ncbi:MAG: hypothetical protein ABI986_00515 [Chloroflexota bacterium]
MNKQLNTSDFVEEINNDTNDPLEQSNHFDGSGPVMEGTLIHETSPSSMISADDPLDEMDVPEASNKTAVDEKINLENMISTKEAPAALLDQAESERMHERWSNIQHMFVDEPHFSVQQADALVAEVITKITDTIANEYSSLEGQWNKSEDVSTEDLRQILKQYRAFFIRLLVV